MNPSPDIIKVQPGKYLCEVFSDTKFVNIDKPVTGIVLERIVDKSKSNLCQHFFMKVLVRNSVILVWGKDDES